MSKHRDAPLDMTELAEALDGLASRELKRQKKALFPAIRAQQRAVKRVREIWRDLRGGKTDPSRPILDVIHARNGHTEESTVTVTEELPDGAELVAAEENTTVMGRPAEGWTPQTMFEAAKVILGIRDPHPADLNELVICGRKWCGAIRVMSIEQRAAGRKCPLCKGKSWRVYSVAAGEFERRQEQIAPKPARGRKAGGNGQPAGAAS